MNDNLECDKNPEKLLILMTNLSLLPTKSVSTIQLPFDKCSFAAKSKHGLSIQVASTWPQCAKTNS